MGNKNVVIFREVLGSIGVVFLVVFVFVVSFFVLYGIDVVYVMVCFNEFIFMGDEGSIGRFSSISE